MPAQARANAAGSVRHNTRVSHVVPPGDLQDQNSQADAVAGEVAPVRRGTPAASSAILLDAMGAGTMNDDRAPDPGLRAAMDEAIALMATWPEARHQVHG